MQYYSSLIKEKNLQAGLGKEAKACCVCEYSLDLIIGQMWRFLERMDIKDKKVPQRGILPMSEELLLLQKMKAGDESALEFFFKEYAELLYFRALGFVHDQLVAQDIIQEVFIKFWEKRSQLEISYSVSAYLNQSVVNACKNHLEYVSVRQRYANKYRQDFDEEEIEYDTEELERLRMRLHPFIDSLPDKCREIFILACVEGLKYREVAERLGVSVNTVKTQVKVAYQRLRDEFDHHDHRLIIFFLFIRFFS